MEVVIVVKMKMMLAKVTVIYLRKIFRIIKKLKLIVMLFSVVQADKNNDLMMIKLLTIKEMKVIKVMMLIMITVMMLMIMIMMLKITVMMLMIMVMLLMIMVMMLIIVMLIMVIW